MFHIWFKIFIEAKLSRGEANKFSKHQDSQI